MAEQGNKEKPLEIVAQVRAGDVRAASRLITRVESGDSSITPVLKKLFGEGSDTAIIGITGPPGAGKSTFVNQLVKHYRGKQERIAVLAVDPSSPLSGGAILGDRVRMNEHAADAGVFIRSMAARGQLGGLAKACGDALTILQSMGFNKIVLETVGVGQSEVDIMRYASTLLVMQMPGAGDRVQSVKAGVLEIGDIYVVNKADLAGAEQVASALEEMLHLQAADTLTAPVLLTEAVNGAGMTGVVDAIEAHIQATSANAPETKVRAEQRARHRVAEICQQLVADSVFSGEVLSGEEVSELLDRRQDPYTLAEMILRQSR